MEAATAAFTRDGFKGARMRSIASDAGITIQLLTYHVKNKERLWEMVMEHMLAHYELFRTDTKTLPQDASASARLRRLIADIVRYSASEPKLHRIMTQEGAQPSPRLAWLSEKFTRPAYEEFVALAAQAQREGSIRSDIQPERLRFAVVAMASVPFSVSAEYEYFTGKDPFSRGEIEQTINLILHMVFED
ncbi:TetR/AcrR family transcriptional regulator [Sphingobium sp. 15-1]|uniref:TetR/AcrR family transcriptional regulator n=1 Tax=Sphingobium sp. 15-1 TaxID=2729616 RepID=UPI00159C2575|nr:TetR family transcriptional regulator [Sphingobium sp. 15-1]